MRITVIGLWHLGCVTAACLSRHHKVIGLELSDPENLDRLRRNVAPLGEPGLSELMKAQKASGALHFTSAMEHTISCETDVLWVCHDVPVDANGTPDPEPVLKELRGCLDYLPAGKLVILSSQFPVGTCRNLETLFPKHKFAVIPENLKIGRAVDAFDRPGRIVFGVRVPLDQCSEIYSIFTNIKGEMAPMSPESAEMTKHALNGYLALSIAYINEIQRICSVNGADVKDVSHGLMSDPRIGPKAYLRPGAPFSGWTLVRDLTTLSRLGAHSGLHIIPAIRRSNDTHAERTGVRVNYGKTK